MNAAALEISTHGGVGEAASKLAGYPRTEVRGLSTAA
jgi:hypothetical protein